LAEEHARQHHGVTLAVLAVSALAYAVSQTMVAPALPAIQHALHTTTTGVTWVLTIYLLTASIATPVLGRLGDMFGKERMLVVVLVMFALGSLVAALSHSIGMLIAGRAIQGFGGAVFPLAFGIIRDEFPAERVPAGIGLISATFGIGGGAGLVAAGLIVDHLTYEWIFWIGLIVTAIAIVATVLFVPESPLKVPAKIDWAGALLLSIGLAALLLGISEGPRWGWSSARVLGAFATSVVALGAWVRWELRVPNPLVDMRMMRKRAVWTTNLAGLLVGFGMFGSFILIPQFVQAPPGAGYGFHATVTEAGLILLPSTTVMLFAGPIAGWLGGRGGSRLPLLIGTALAAIAFGFIAVAHDHRWELYVGSALMGAGIGFAFAAMANLIVEAVDPTETGVATGMNTIMRTVGGSLGGQISATIVSADLIAGTHIAAENGYTTAFALSSLVMVLAFGATLLVPLRARLHTTSAAASRSM
jgi:EmrB/QacA subfamily drug resistance transporter